MASLRAGDAMTRMVIDGRLAGSLGQRRVEVVNHPNRRPKTFTVKIGPMPRKMELHHVLEAITEEIWARGYTPDRRDRINIEHGRGVSSINFSILED